MTPLRAKYIRDLAIRGRATRTQQSYTSYVADLARYHRRSPDQISYDEVANWLQHLIKERKQSASSVNIAVNAVRFLYSVTLGRDVAPLLASVPRMKRNVRRAEVYARTELEGILTAPPQPRDEGKGAKERVLPLSPRLLSELEAYWRAQRAGKPGHHIPWLFLGDHPDRPMSRGTGQNIYYRAVKKSGVRRKGGIHILRHSFATHCIENGIELPVVQRLLGHSSLLTTARYLHVTAQRLGQVGSPLDLIDLSRVAP